MTSMSHNREGSGQLGSAASRLQNLKNCHRKTVPVDKGPCAHTHTLTSLDQALLNNYFDIDTLDLLNVTPFQVFVITDRGACAKTGIAPLNVAWRCNFPTHVNGAF